MSGSSPDDLAVAFRSIHRRAAQALEPVGGDPSIGAAERAGLDRIVADAATLLGTAPRVEAIATELEDRPADSWTDTDLDRLRSLALDAGRLLRRIEDEAERRAGDAD